MSTDCVEVYDCPLLRLLLVEGVSLSSREGVKGDEGKGRCPAIPTKLLRVGVLREGSSGLTSSPIFESFRKPASGRGVVGVVSSPERPGGGSGTARVVLTAWKLDMLGWFSSCKPGMKGPVCLSSWAKSPVCVMLARSIGDSNTLDTKRTST